MVSGTLGTYTPLYTHCNAVHARLIGVACGVSGICISVLAFTRECWSWKCLPSLIHHQTLPGFALVLVDMRGSQCVEREGVWGDIREETEGWEEKSGEYPVWGPGTSALGSWNQRGRREREGRGQERESGLLQWTPLGDLLLAGCMEVQTYKYLGVHLSDKLGVGNECGQCPNFQLLWTFYESVASSAIFYIAVCWGSGITTKDTNRL